jgi:hypothetical protein
MADPSMKPMKIWNSGCPAFELVNNTVVQKFADTHADGSRHFRGKYSALCSDSEVRERQERVDKLAKRRVPIGVWEADQDGKPTIRYCEYV